VPPESGPLGVFCFPTEIFFPKNQIFLDKTGGERIIWCGFLWVEVVESGENGKAGVKSFNSAGNAGGPSPPAKGERSFLFMAGYTGTYRTSVDDKGRLAIPARLRREGAEKLFLSPGFGAYLVLYPEAEWEEINKNLGGQSFTRGVYRDFSRFLYANTQEVAPDAQGRILIPESFLKEAGILGEAMVLGVARWMEIWSPARYQKFMAGFKPKWNQTAEKIMPGPAAGK
jgi:MraZ protein